MGRRCVLAGGFGKCQRLMAVICASRVKTTYELYVAVFLSSVLAFGKEGRELAFYHHGYPYSLLVCIYMRRMFFQGASIPTTLLI